MLFILARAVTYSILFCGLMFVFLPARVLTAAGVARPATTGALQILGMILVFVGVSLAAWCILAFVAIGRGTPAPFDPPIKLVIRAPYRFVRNPAAAKDPYLATVANNTDVLACAVYLAPFKLVLTRANREPIVALAQDVFTIVPQLEGITGPDRSATDFAIAWGKLTGVTPELGMRMRIHETRALKESDRRVPLGRFRAADEGDLELLSEWTDVFVAEAKIPEKVDAKIVVGDAIRRGRLHVWDDGGPVSMAAWTGRTPSGVRINFVYTPKEHRGKGYATACVSALTRQELERGSAFCWLYTDLSSAASPNIFKRIGYWPVSDVAEYYLKPVSSAKPPSA